MIKNTVELTKVLCDQAQNSGFARAAIVIVMGYDNNISKTEFGFNKQNLSPVAEESAPEEEAQDIKDNDGKA